MTKTALTTMTTALAIATAGLTGCNSEGGEEAKRKVEESTRGLKLGEGGNFTAPTSTPTPTPAEQATAKPAINAIPESIGNFFTLTGTAEPDSEVGVFSGEDLVGETVANGNGDWTLELSDLGTGPLLFSAVAIAPGKTASEPSEPRSTTVLAPLTAPAITGPTGEVSGIAATLTGTSVPGTEVTAWVQGPAMGTRNGWNQVDTTNTSGGTVVEDDGLWNGNLGAELPTPLSVNGTYRAYARAVKDLGEGGFQAAESPVFFITVKNAVAPAAPTISTVEQAEGGFWPLTVSGTATPGVEVVLFLEEASEVDDDTPWVPWNSVVAEEDGSWSYVIDSLPEGDYLLAARGKNPENFYGDSSEVVKITAPAAAAE